VVSFIGGKGGVGTTAMAINFAAEMAERGQPVALVDLNLYVGDVAEAVGVVPEPSLNWFLKKADRMDAQLLRSSAPKHPRGLQVFGLTEDLSSIDALGADQISRFFSALRIAYKWIIVDCGSNFAEETLSGIANSDYRVMVTSSDRLSIAGTRRRVEALKNVVEDPQNTKLIINRMGDGREIDPSKVERAFGVGLLGTVRNAWTEVAGSMESRSLLLDHSPDAGVTQDIALMVDRITGGSMESSANRPPQLARIAS
jgi:pilus assembly protein CpaE